MKNKQRRRHLLTSLMLGFVIFCMLFGILISLMMEGFRGYQNLQVDAMSETMKERMGDDPIQRAAYVAYMPEYAYLTDPAYAETYKQSLEAKYSSTYFVFLGLLCLAELILVVLVFFWKKFAFILFMALSSAFIILPIAFEWSLSDTLYPFAVIWLAVWSMHLKKRGCEHSAYYWIMRKDRQPVVAEPQPETAVQAKAVPAEAEYSKTATAIFLAIVFVAVVAGLVAYFN